MRSSGASSGDLPVFPIMPVLRYYGGEDMDETTGYGWRPYKCPFHGDSTASASVNTTEQYFNCHAADCPKGSATQIIMRHEGKTYREAVERAKEISGSDGASVRGASGRRGRRSGGTRGRSGTRTFKRTWGSD